MPARSFETPLGPLTVREQDGAIDGGDGLATKARLLDLERKYLPA